MRSATCVQTGWVPRGATLGRAPGERPRIESRPQRFSIKAAILDRDGAKQVGDPCLS